MERWLVFDAHCIACSELASEIHARSRNALTARSLDDPQVVALLDRHRPGWKREPMLVMPDADPPRIQVGFSMVLALARLMGPRYSLGLIRELGRRPTGQSPDAISRRSAIGRAAGIIGTVVLGAGGADAATATGKTTHERGGFVHDERIKSWLRQQPDISASTARLGDPDWSSVYLKDDTYVPQHLDPPGGAQAAYTAISTDGQTAVSYAVLITGGGPSIELMSPTGLSYGTLRLQSLESGRSSFVPEPNAEPRCSAAPSHLEPDHVSFKFFAACMVDCTSRRLTADCLQSCFTCYPEHHPLSYSCIKCGMCAGPNTVKCAKECSSQC